MIAGIIFIFAGICWLVAAYYSAGADETAMMWLAMVTSIIQFVAGAANLIAA